MNPVQEYLFEISAPFPEEPQRASQESPVKDRKGRVEFPIHPRHRRALEDALEPYQEALGKLALSPSYYRYRGLTHTVRIRRNRLFVRISHHFENEEPRVIEAVGHILFRKILRRRQLKKEWEIARDAERRLEPIVANESVPSPNPRISQRHWRPPEGKVHNLHAMTKSLSARFFESRFPDIPLAWTARNVKGYWGKYFAEPPMIVLNRKLDHAKVPVFVVEAVLYHEMLHHHLGIEKTGGRRRIHTQEFRQAENLYPQMKEAEDFLQNFPKRTRRWFQLG